MVVLIVLNIILIIALIFLALYIVKNKKDGAKNVCVDCDDLENDIEDDEIENIKYKQKNESKSERIFVGRFVTDDEYRQMSKNRRSDISILMEEINREYEHLKKIR